LGFKEAIFYIVYIDSLLAQGWDQQHDGFVREFLQGIAQMRCCGNHYLDPAACGVAHHVEGCYLRQMGVLSL
jgi:hypothetical protein